jgi:hypothetical protein
MLVFLIIVTVLIGIAYADYCLIDNTAHFGICFARVAEAEEAREEETAEAVASRRDSFPAQADTPPDPHGCETPARLPVAVPEWLFLEMEPLLGLPGEAP